MGKNASIMTTAVIAVPMLLNKTGAKESLNPERSAPEVLEELLKRAESAGASDIHLQMLGKTAQVSFRLDGVMTPATEIPDPLAERVFGRIKFLARLKTYQESLP